MRTIERNHMIAEEIASVAPSDQQHPPATVVDGDPVKRSRQSRTVFPLLLLSSRNLRPARFGSAVPLAVVFPRPQASARFAPADGKKQPSDERFAAYPSMPQFFSKCPAICWTLLGDGRPRSRL